MWAGMLRRLARQGQPINNLSEDQLSKWKQHFLENAVSVFSATDQQSSKDAERIAHLERLVGRMAVSMDIEKKH